MPITEGGEAAAEAAPAPVEAKAEASVAAAPEAVAAPAEPAPVPEPAPVKTPAEEPVAVVLTEPDPNRPKRGGWWNRLAGRS